MRGHTSRILYLAVALGALLLVSCGGSEGMPTVPVDEQVAPPEATIAPTPTEEPSGFFQETPTAQESLGECGPPAAEITLGTPVSGETVNDDQPPASREYFCVMVPDGLTTLTFELSDMTADLNLYIGYPDLETVQEGGFDFWFTQERGTENKVVVVDRGSSRLIKPGAYYIEVSAEDFSASSPFTLTVSTP